MKATDISGHFRDVHLCQTCNRLFIEYWVWHIWPSVSGKGPETKHCWACIQPTIEKRIKKETKNRLIKEMQDYVAKYPDKAAKKLGFRK